jgi:hypothetical protein
MKQGVLLASRAAGVTVLCVLLGACTPPPATVELARERIAEILDCQESSVAFDYVDGTKYGSGYIARGCGRRGLFRCYHSAKHPNLFVCELVERSGDWTAGPAPPIQLTPPPPILQPGDT